MLARVSPEPADREEAIEDVDGGEDGLFFVVLLAVEGEDLLDGVTAVFMADKRLVLVSHVDIKIFDIRLGRHLVSLVEIVLNEISLFLLPNAQVARLGYLGVRLIAVSERLDQIAVCHRHLFANVLLINGW